jgi:nucleoside-diphosphate-sugar epimerase
MTPVAALTGAYGYLGSLIRDRLDAAGWETIALVREPRPGDRAFRWALGEAPPEEALAPASALVHCAYDFGPRRLEDACRVNVDGTALLLEAAGASGVGRSLVLSSMSAYQGTDQIYGQIKLRIEAETVGRAGIAVRPGLVYGDDPRGMAGTLIKLARLPIAPDFGPAARQFPVHEGDLAEAIFAILSAAAWKPEIFGIAQPVPISFRSLLLDLVAAEDRRPRFVPTPWRLVYWSLRVGEALRVSPLRADSILGLVRPAPAVPPSTAFPGLLSGLRTMAGTPEAQGATT